MFSLAINSICDCSRAHSPAIAAATSGSAAASGSRKKPSPRGADNGRAEEIARTTPLGEQEEASGRAEYGKSTISRAPMSAAYQTSRRDRPYRGGERDFPRRGKNHRMKNLIQ